MFRKRTMPDGRPRKSIDRVMGFWLVWTVMVGLAFSEIDWRQTKHLMPLMLTFHLAPARWAASHNAYRVLVGVLMAGLIVWNVSSLCGLAADFDAFDIARGW